jgi:hypothetical protein
MRLYIEFKSKIDIIPFLQIKRKGFDFNEITGVHLNFLFLRVSCQIRRKGVFFNQKKVKK